MPDAALVAARRLLRGEGRGVLLAPVRCGGRGDEALLEAAGLEVHPLRRRLARILRVLQPHLQRVDAERRGELVHVLLDGEGRLQVAVAAKRAGIGIVRVHRGRVVLAVRDAVQRRDGLHHHERRRRAPGGVRAVVVQRLADAKGQRAVLLRTAAQAQQHRLPGRRRDEFLFAREHELHRPVGRLGEEHADRLERIDVELRAEAAADRRLDDADAGRVHAQDLGELALVQEGHLRVRVQRQVAGRVEFGDHAGHAHAAVRHVVQAEPVVDDHVGFGLAGRDVALRVVERHGHVVPVRVGIAGFARLQRFVRRRRWQLLVVDHRRAGLQGVGRIGQRRQILVLDLDQAQRRGGDLRGIGGDRGDLVAQAPHLVALEGQLILAHAQRPLVGNVGRGEHRMDSGQGPRPG